jgi:5-methylcytosine-specific restriction endonuclease McrA
MSLEQRQLMIKQKLIQRDGEYCQICKGTTNLTLDHIIPCAILQFLGIDRAESHKWRYHSQNFQLLCKQCNQLKRDRINWTDPRSKPLLLEYIENLNKEQMLDDE